MIIPEFLKKGDIIGVTAASCGVLDKIDKYENSINNIKKYGFKIKETSNVRTSGIVSSSDIERAKELESLYLDNEVKMISIASGGDFLFDMLDNIDYSIIKDNIKWISGSSDPTSLLFLITTNYDIATIYSPCNMSGFDLEPLHQSYLNYFEILKGNLIKQEKFLYCEDKSFSDVFDKVNKWTNINGNVNEEGILIGGCIECLKDIIGTKYDKTKEFVEKYKDDGIIWYFDVFSMTSEDLYKTLIQFKYAGWFKYTKAILIGKVCFANSFIDYKYEDAIKNALPDMKVIYQFDVGHVKPSFTMINGVKVKIMSNENEGNMEYFS
ncbi:MAG TPA: LD-carboxypeptidase [Candidatus Coprovivens excrementavium]|nr:LD-carboxypeptidase [Candidatus Coprovivens excrementavium]